MTFSYYGSRSRVVHLYDKPRYRKIIEPFCGSARYSVRYYNKDVWINDKYEVVYRIWKWIQQSSKKDVTDLPDLKAGEKIEDIKWLCQEERWLLGFCVNMGASSPCNVMTQWGSTAGRRYSSIGQLKANLRRIVGKIDHWNITNLSYSKIPNQNATWFIDAPYQQGGEYYVHSKVNYKSLGEWCQRRQGQIIVCESQGADWLPFEPLKESATFRGKGSVKEVVWSRSDKKIGFGLL